MKCSNRESPLDQNPDNMTHEFSTALRLIASLDSTFPNSQSLIVGGAVRDHLLNHEACDVDIATNVPLDEIAKYFVVRDITKNTLHAQPVSVIAFEDIVFEIASFRSDSFGVEGRANNKAEIVSTFEEDSARRDITINSIGMNASMEIIDPQGGLRDLRENIVRAVGIPAMRFREDATRILRVFRFAARFGYRIEHDTLMTAIQNAWRLNDPKQISQESIAKELFKGAGSGPQLARFIAALTSANLIRFVLPEIYNLIGLTHDPIHHPEAKSEVLGHVLECLNSSTSRDPVANLAILFHDLGKATTRELKANGHSSYHGHEGAGVPIVEEIFARLKFPDLSSHDKDNILFAVKRHMLIHDLDALSRRTQMKLVHDPGWPILKEVGLCDAISRNRANAESIATPLLSTFARIEDKVHSIAASANDLRLKVKAYVDGHKVQLWFPETKENLKMLKPILEATAEFILDNLGAGKNPSQEEIQQFIANVIDNTREA
jgi:tRNA nucleotidyltransferase/poly(A) polymerase